MIDILEIKKAIDNINIGSEFFYLAPKAFYDRKGEKVVYLNIEDYQIYYELMNNQDENIGDNFVYQVLNDSTNFVAITIYFTILDIAYQYIELNNYNDLEPLLEKNFKDFKKEIIKRKLYDDFYDFKDKYILTRAITFCYDNNIIFKN